MPIKQSKRKRGKFRKYRIHILLLTGLIVALGVAFWPAYIWNSQLQNEMNVLTQQKQMEEQQSIALHEEIRRLNTPDYVEQLARQDLGLVKPGEVPITPVTPINP
ncbi:MAG: septum formation initiator family protein [Peptococcaceae bacterium]|nr:septum formation initiator family protein [Peptococcaceae bacterium]